MHLRHYVNITAQIDPPSAEQWRAYTEIGATITIKGSRSDIVTILAFLDKHIEEKNHGL